MQTRSRVLYSNFFPIDRSFFVTGYKNWLIFNTYEKKKKRKLMHTNIMTFVKFQT